MHPTPFEVRSDITQEHRDGSNPAPIGLELAPFLHQIVASAISPSALGSGTETRPPHRLAWPHGAPRPTTFPARSACTGVLYRENLTSGRGSPPFGGEDGGVVDPDEAGNRRRLSTPALSATVADASDGAPCCQLAPCIVARHRR